MTTQEKIDLLRKHSPYQEYFDKYIVPTIEGNVLTHTTIDTGTPCSCPLHVEDTPSFRVRIRDGVLYHKCFGCDNGGDIVKLHQQYEDVNFGRKINRFQAAEELYDILHGDSYITKRAANKGIVLASDKEEEQLSSLTDLAMFAVYLDRLEVAIRGLGDTVDADKKFDLLVTLDECKLLVERNELAAKEAESELKKEFTALTDSKK